jgi:hypothetical protein
LSLSLEIKCRLAAGVADLLPKADIRQPDWDVRYVPKADITLLLVAGFVASWFVASDASQFGLMQMPPSQVMLGRTN